MVDAERQRLAEADGPGIPWRRWGPYLSERQWGTVREDYSRSGDAWAYFSHDQARFRSYRWGEDGLAGISGERQLLCLSLALWNGRDPILKERLFGLTNSAGNHGEDVKEYYFYLDATPTLSYLKMLYKYPQAEYPYNDHGRDEPVAGQARSRVRAARHGCSRRRSLFRCRGRIRQSDAGRHPDAGHRPGRQLNLFEVAREIGDRLTGTFAQTADGRRPVYGERDIFHTSPHWRDLLLFYEYFNGDNGSGVGASHQTGWTGTVALLPLLLRGATVQWVRARRGVLTEEPSE